MLAKTRLCQGPFIKIVCTNIRFGRRVNLIIACAVQIRKSIRVEFKGEALHEFAVHFLGSLVHEVRAHTTV